MKNLSLAICFIILALFFYILNSADQSLKHPKNSTKIVEKEKPEKQEKDFFDRCVRENLKIIIIDGCEYIYGCIGGMDGILLTHKGNCKNPEHKGNK